MPPSPSKRAEFERLIKKAATDFELFARIVGKIKPGKHQKEWFRICQEIGDNPFGGKKYIIVAPPGSGKSQLVGVLFVAWMIGRYPDEHYGLICYGDQPAKQRSLAVRRIIESSNEYHRIFPNIKPDKTQWGTYALKVQREDTTDFHPTLRAGGATASIVSFRLSGVVYDDPHDPKNSDTPDKREKVYRNWEQAIKTRLLDGAFRLLITTRWADDDFAGTLLRKEKGSWGLTVTPAITARGTSYWPEQKSVEELRLIEKENPETFAIQYMGDTTLGESSIFKQLHTYDGTIEIEEVKLRVQTGIIDPFSNRRKYYHPEYGELDLLIGMGGDTASKDKQKNDFSVLYVGGLDQFGRVWILDRRKGRWMMPELMQNITELYHDYNPYAIWIEDASSGTPAVQTLKAKMPYMPLELIPPPPGGKRSKALSIQTDINGGNVKFPREAEWFDDTSHEMTRYGSVAHDDDMDALYMLLSNLLVVVHPSHYEMDGRLKADLYLR